MRVLAASAGALVVVALALPFGHAQFDPTVPLDLADDADGDGITNGDEARLDTDAQNADSDGGGAPDGWEVSHGLDPLDAADDGADPDGDGLSSALEAEFGTDPHNPDTDGDGYEDSRDMLPLTPDDDTMCSVYLWAEPTCGDGALPWEVTCAMGLWPGEAGCPEDMHPGVVPTDGRATGQGSGAGFWQAGGQGNGQGQGAGQTAGQGAGSGQGGGAGATASWSAPADSDGDGVVDAAAPPRER